MGNKEIRLHLGCGKVRLPEFINIDIDESVHPDKVMSIQDLKFKTDSVDVIYASHVLDHLSFKSEVDRTLFEWNRVLKPGGLLQVAVSDFEKIAVMYNEGLSLEKLLTGIVGGHKTPFDRHGCVFDFKLLRDYLERNGFRGVRRYDWRRTYQAIFDDFSQAYIPHMDKINGILMSLNVEAVK